MEALIRCFSCSASKLTDLRACSECFVIVCEPCARDGKYCRCCTQAAGNIGKLTDLKSVSPVAGRICDGLATDAKEAVVHCFICCVPGFNNRICPTCYVIYCGTCFDQWQEKAKTGQLDQGKNSDKQACLMMTCAMCRSSHSFDSFFHDRFVSHLARKWVRACDDKKGTSLRKLKSSSAKKTKQSFEEKPQANKWYEHNISKKKMYVMWAVTLVVVLIAAMQARSIHLGSQHEASGVATIPEGIPKGCELPWSGAIRDESHMRKHMMRYLNHFEGPHMLSGWVYSETRCTLRFCQVPPHALGLRWDRMERAKQPRRLGMGWDPWNEKRLGPCGWQEPWHAVGSTAIAERAHWDRMNQALLNISRTEYLEPNQIEAVIETLQSIEIRREVHNPSAIYDLYKIHKNMQHLEETPTVPKILEIASSVPHFSWLMVLAIGAVSRAGDEKKALELASQCRVHNPDNAMCNFAHSMIAERLGMRKEALRSRKAGNKLFPSCSSSCCLAALDPSLCNEFEKQESLSFTVRL